MNRRKFLSSTVTLAAGSAVPSASVSEGIVIPAKQVQDIGATLTYQRAIRDHIKLLQHAMFYGTVRGIKNTKGSS